MTSQASAQDEGQNGRGRRLESWKAIARHLDRDVRSVQRWERERALPVHRTPGDKGTVFAYESELDRWLHSRQDEEVAPANESPVLAAASASRARWPVFAIVAGLALILAVAILLLRRPAASVPSAPVPMKSLAVLPLVNLSGDPSQTYFADGFTEELTTELSQIRSMRVISRTSTMLFAGSREPLPRIARELHADYILEGSVLRNGARVRVIAQLIDAATDTHISARTYNTDVKDVVAVQGDISRAIARDVRLDLSPEEEKRLASATSVDPDAHDLYLRGSYAFAAQTPQSLKESLDLYQAAARKDPRFARAYVGIALAEQALLQLTLQRPEETYRQVKQNAEHALALDPGLGDARGMLASIAYFHDWNWPEAERQFRLALLEGALAPTEQRFGTALVTRGLFDEGKRHLLRAMELDPLGKSPRINWLVTMQEQLKFPEARREAEKMLAAAPNFVAGHVLRLSAAMGEHNCAVTSVEARWLRQHFPSAFTNVESSFDAACRGDQATARKYLEAIDLSKGPPFASPYQISLGYGVIGDKEATLRFLERSGDIHESLVLSMKVEPAFYWLRTDPRYIALEKRLGLPLP